MSSMDDSKTSFFEGILFGVCFGFLGNFVVTLYLDLCTPSFHEKLVLLVLCLVVFFIAFAYVFYQVVVGIIKSLGKTYTENKSLKLPKLDYFWSMVFFLIVFLIILMHVILFKEMDVP